MYMKEKLSNENWKYKIFSEQKQIELKTYSQAVIYISNLDWYFVFRVILNELYALKTSFYGWFFVFS